MHEHCQVAVLPRSAIACLNRCQIIVKLTPILQKKTRYNKTMYIYIIYIVIYSIYLQVYRDFVGGGVWFQMVSRPWACYLVLVLCGCFVPAKAVLYLLPSPIQRSQVWQGMTNSPTGVHPTARWKGTFRWWFRNPSPVDMENLPTIIYNILYMSGGCLGFLNHQQYESHRAQGDTALPPWPTPASSQCLQSKALRKMTLFWCRVACVTTQVKTQYFTRKKLNKKKTWLIEWYWCKMF